MVIAVRWGRGYSRNGYRGVFGRRSEKPQCHRLQVLDDGCEVELVAITQRIPLTACARSDDGSSCVRSASRPSSSHRGTSRTAAYPSARGRNREPLRAHGATLGALASLGSTLPALVNCSKGTYFTFYAGREPINAPPRTASFHSNSQGRIKPHAQRDWLMEQLRTHYTECPRQIGTNSSPCGSSKETL
jgi:hypothetical protein